MPCCSQGFAVAVHSKCAPRNFFSLLEADLQVVVDGFQRALLDDKLEIRDLASSGLSGLVKLLPAPSAQLVRSTMLSSAAHLFPKHKPAKSATAAVTKQQHACVLGLRALLQSSPHRIPDWCAPECQHQRACCPFHTQPCARHGLRIVLPNVPCCQNHLSEPSGLCGGAAGPASSRR